RYQGSDHLLLQPAVCQRHSAAVRDDGISRPGTFNGWQDCQVIKCSSFPSLGRWPEGRPPKPPPGLSYTTLRNPARCPQCPRCLPPMPAGRSAILCRLVSCFSTIQKIG